MFQVTETNEQVVIGEDTDELPIPLDANSTSFSIDNLNATFTLWVSEAQRPLSIASRAHITHFTWPLAHHNQEQYVNLCELEEYYLQVFSSHPHK